MIQNIKNKIIGSLFILIISSLLIINISTQDLEKNERENRNLQMFPNITLEKFFSGKLSKEFIDYVDDQFANKDIFTQLKSWINYNGFNKSINNGIYSYKGFLVEALYPIKYNKLDLYVSNVEKIEGFINKEFLTIVVPDKSMYLPNDMLKIDYKEFLEYLPIEVYDINNQLTLDDYYLTDLHWNHMGAYKAYKVIIEELLGEEYIDVEFKKIEENFRGYYSNKAMDLKPRDNMFIAENEIINSLKISYTENLVDFYSKIGPYYYDQLETDDKYNIYLNGNFPLVTITNDKANNNKELVIFKDSYGISIAPFLAMHYNKVTMIDLRIVKIETIMEDINTDADFILIHGFKTIQDSSIMN